jgi:hypothetical protein
LNIYLKPEIRGMLLWSVASEDLAVEIFSVEVVPFFIAKSS